MSHLDALLESNPVPSWRPFAWAIMVLLTVFLIWANFANLNEFAIAQGEVIPQGQVKTIQHLEGGIIVDILVRDGQRVKEGDSLLQLALAPTALNPEELQIRIDGLLLTKARLEAEANDTPLEFPEAEAARRPQLVKSERDKHEARMQELKGTLAVLEEQVTQKRLSVRELETNRNTLNQNLALLRKKFAMSKDLLKDGLVPKMEHVTLQTELSNLEGQLAALEDSIPGAQSALAEAEGRVEETKLGFKRETLELLGDVELSLARDTELQTKATDQKLRTTIKSPIDGTVKNLRHHTIGGIVGPGEPILELVPSQEQLVIDAKLMPADRGLVQEGQPAVVQISAYDYARYGVLKGKVVLVAPDTTINQDGTAYYRVVVVTEKTWLGEKQGQLPITPGMQATVDIQTGTRTVMDYLIKPVLKMKHEAFREP